MPANHDCKVDQSMVKVGRWGFFQWGAFAGAALAGAALFASSAPTTRTRALVVSATAFGIFVGLVPLLLYALMRNHDWGAYFVSKIQYKIMSLSDRELTNVKRELLKTMKGRVVDVGAGAGNWLYYFEDPT